MSHVFQVGDICRARVLCNVANNVQAAYNYLAYKCFNVTGASSTDLALATALDTALAGVYKAFMGADARYRGVGVQVHSPALYVEQASVAGAGPGTLTKPLLPGNVSGLISFRCAVAGKKNRGRIYPPFPMTDWSDIDGDMNAAGMTALTNISNAIPLTQVVGGGGNTATLNLVIWDGASAVPNLVATKIPIQAFASQRRRGQTGHTNIVMPF